MGPSASTQIRFVMGALASSPAVTECPAGRCEEGKRQKAGGCRMQDAGCIRSARHQEVCHPERRESARKSKAESARQAKPNLPAEGSPPRLARETSPWPWTSCLRRQKFLRLRSRTRCAQDDKPRGKRLRLPASCILSPSAFYLLSSASPARYIPALLSDKLKVAPSPSLLRQAKWPPMASASWRTMASPRPLDDSPPVGVALSLAKRP